MSRQKTAQTKTSESSTPDTNTELFRRGPLNFPGAHSKQRNTNKKSNISVRPTKRVHNQNNKTSFNKDFSTIMIKQSTNPTLQTKLMIGQKNDKYEQEADRVSKQIMQITDTQTQRHSKSGKTLPENTHQTSFRNNPVNNGTRSMPALPSSTKSMQTSGRSLNEQERSYFEPRINADFSNVRVHSNPETSSAASIISARAFTIGNHIAIAKNQYDFGSSRGKRLMAHELTHVVQQTMTTHQSPSIDNRGLSSSPTHVVQRDSHETEEEEETPEGEFTVTSEGFELSFEVPINSGLNLGPVELLNGIEAEIEGSGPATGPSTRRIDALHTGLSLNLARLPVLGEIERDIGNGNIFSLGSSLSLDANASLGSETEAELSLSSTTEAGLQSRPIRLFGNQPFRFTLDAEFSPSVSFNTSGETEVEVEGSLSAGLLFDANGNPVFIRFTAQGNLLDNPFSPTNLSLSTGFRF
ncbi:MAG: DUF4157 domain-containing protein [Gammaproteobacteria bacterium]|nr:DUF4157 domain-containing protein [Gammaproteobacteria bacterium]